MISNAQRCPRRLKWRDRLGHSLCTAVLGPLGFCFWTVCLKSYHERVCCVEMGKATLAYPGCVGAPFSPAGSWAVPYAGYFPPQLMR